MALRLDTLLGLHPAPDGFFKGKGKKHQFRGGVGFWHSIGRYLCIFRIIFSFMNIVPPQIILLLASLSIYIHA